MKSILQYIKESVDRKFDLRGLVQCLKRYNQVGDYARNGHWEIGSGGYDLNWELSYDRVPIIGCVRKEIELYTTDGKSNSDDVIDKVLSVYTDLKYVDEEE